MTRKSTSNYVCSFPQYSLNTCVFTSLQDGGSLDSDTSGPLAQLKEKVVEPHGERTQYGERRLVPGLVPLSISGLSGYVRYLHKGRHT